MPNLTFDCFESLPIHVKVFWSPLTFLLLKQEEVEVIEHVSGGAPELGEEIELGSADAEDPPVPVYAAAPPKKKVPLYSLKVE